VGHKEFQKQPVMFSISWAIRNFKNNPSDFLGPDIFWRIVFEKSVVY
jgi:hypothetical protein